MINDDVLKNLDDALKESMALIDELENELTDEELDDFIKAKLEIKKAVENKDFNALEEIKKKYK